MDAIGPLLASWWVLGIIFTLLLSFGTAPMILFYFAWRLHRNVRRIADAVEHMAYDTQRQAVQAAQQHSKPIVPHEPGIVGSAFGR
ncbi:MAG TPA: hypothetical protein VGT24_00825 [Candidatus Acidoferrales bacterium]|nr:hypothetical protein [Candidatus Acidoferrales bacterium]